MTYDLQDYFTLSEEYEITNVTKRKSKTGQGKCLGSGGKFRDFCLVSTVTLLPSHQLDFTALIFGDKKWMEDAQ